MKKQFIPANLRVLHLQTGSIVTTSGDYIGVGSSVNEGLYNNAAAPGRLTPTPPYPGY